MQDLSFLMINLIGLLSFNNPYFTSFHVKITKIIHFKHKNIVYYSVFLCFMKFYFLLTEINISILGHLLNFN